MTNFDPKQPKDLLGRPYGEGDVVVFAPSSGSGITVAEVHEVRYVRKNDMYPSHSNKEWVKCERHQAEDHRIYLTPIESTAFISYYNDAGDYSYHKKPGYKARPRKINLKANIVKLEPINGS